MFLTILFVSIAVLGVGACMYVHFYEAGVYSDIGGPYPVDIALRDADVIEILAMHRAQRYEIETFVESFSSSHVVTFRMIRTDDDEQIKDAVLYWIFISRVTNSVVDIQALGTDGAIQESRKVRAVEAFLYEFPESKSSAEIQGLNITVTWEFQNRSIVLTYGTARHILGVEITDWPSMRRPQINITETEAIDISKNTEQVQRFISMHPNATFNVGKFYLEKSSMYHVTEDWIVLTLAGGALGKGEPLVGKYCWRVHWSDPKSFIPHIVNICVDVETGKIVEVEEAL